jgi:hypothetical protein
MKQVAHSVTVANGKPLTIYAISQSINFFVTPDLVPATSQATRTGDASVPAHTRRRYPGDARPYSVSGSSRDWEYDPASTSGGALPGKSFAIRYKDENNEWQSRQFTFQGRWIDLKRYLKANRARAMNIYSPSGRKTPIAAPSSP